MRAGNHILILFLFSGAFSFKNYHVRRNCGLIIRGGGKLTGAQYPIFSPVIVSVLFRITVSGRLGPGSSAAGRYIAPSRDNDNIPIY